MSSGSQRRPMGYTIEQPFHLRLGLAVAPFVIWGAYLGVFALHVFGRSFCDEWLPWRSLLGFERTLAGSSASAWLQTNLNGEPGQLVARIATALHLGWFAWPIIVGFVLTVRRRELLVEYFLWLIACWFIADVVFLLAPVVPPWMDDPSVRRYLFEHGWIDYAPNDLNAVAAFPSLHACIPLTIAFFLWYRVPGGRWAAKLSGILAAAIGFAVVYLGEHWVADVLAGYGLAAAVAFGACSRSVRGTLCHNKPGASLARLNERVFLRASARTRTNVAAAEASAAPDELPRAA